MHSERIVQIQKLLKAKIIDLRRMPARNLQRAILSPEAGQYAAHSQCSSRTDRITSLYEIALKTEQVCADIPKAVQDRKNRIDLRNLRKMTQLMRKKGFDDSFIYTQCAPFIMDR
jgi:hypothetical protein